VKSGAVEQLAENLADLRFHDAGTVVLDGNAIACSVDLPDLHADLRKDPSLFTGIEGVVDTFLDGREQRLAGRIEAEQMSILEEELGDGDFPLASGELDRRRCASRGSRAHPVLGPDLGNHGWVERS